MRHSEWIHCSICRVEPTQILTLEENICKDDGRKDGVGDQRMRLLVAFQVSRDS